MKRDALIRQLRKQARKEGVAFRIDNIGKGSHIRIIYGHRFTTVKEGELKPGYVALIRKQLAIE